LSKAEGHSQAEVCDESSQLKFYIAREKATGGPSVDTGKEKWYLETPAFFCEKHVSGLEIDQGNGPPAAKIFVTPLGRQIFRTVTSANIGGHIALVLDKVVLAVPRVEGVIDSDVGHVTLNERDIPAWRQLATELSRRPRSDSTP
jgi:preprotein translocase subunit SecD